MNGISSNLLDEIKKSQDSKKKEKFKFIAAVVVTNMLVAILCLPAHETKSATQATHKILHPHHKVMVLPLQALISKASENDPETPVSLVSKDKKIIAEKAYLLEEVKGSAESTQFKIEIPDAEVVKVSQATEQGVIAVPYVENKKTKSIKRGSKYEVSL